ncbi:hypothetical protein DFS34DRAFT_645846 [Phlyctochytrium arcticum]|nr:hypothetical protein DFS34DRAFT_645846 [Phlyctochytrium arcticum]
MDEEPTSKSERKIAKPIRFAKYSPKLRQDQKKSTRTPAANAALQARWAHERLDPALGQSSSETPDPQVEDASPELDSSMDQTEDASAELDSSMDQDGSSIMGGSQAAVLESEENADSSSDETKPFASVSTFSLSHPLHTASEFIKSMYGITITTLNPNHFRQRSIPGLGQRRQNDFLAIMRKVLIDIFSIFAREEDWLYALKRTLNDKV